MMNLYTMERLDVFLVAILFVGQSFGHDYMMTCSRPVVTKTARLLKFDLGLPCDLSKESWCNLPGTNYPWHAVRSFVFENQGLMRRMYGEVRQLSLLRMEFNGNSIDENGREFDEIFKPVNPTMPPTSTTSSSSTSTSTSSSSSSSGESHDSIFMDIDNFNRYYSNNDDGSSPTVPVTIVVRDSDTANYNNNDDANNNSSSSSSKSDSDTSVPSNSMNQTSDFSPNAKNISMNTSETVNMNRTSTEQLTSSSDSIADSLSRLSLDEIGGQIMTTTEETAGTTEGIQTTMMADSPSGSGSISMDEEVTTEAIQHVLFQDAEKTTTATSNSNSRTTTEATDGNQSGDVDSDAPQQVHRSDIKGVNACPVKEEVVAPYWANNTRGEVLALLNLYPFEQYIHWEKCTFEHRQMYCREGCRCEQQYRLHRLLAFDPTNECRGIFSDWFRFPSCCVCKCYLTSSDLAQERFSFNRSPRFQQSAAQSPDPVEPVNGIDDSHFYYKTSNFNSRQPR